MIYIYNVHYLHLSYITVMLLVLKKLTELFNKIQEAILLTMKEAIMPQWNIFIICKRNVHTFLLPQPVLVSSVWSGRFVETIRMAVYTGHCMASVEITWGVVPSYCNIPLSAKASTPVLCFTFHSYTYSNLFFSNSEAYGWSPTTLHNIC